MGGNYRICAVICNGFCFGGVITVFVLLYVMGFVWFRLGWGGFLRGGGNFYCILVVIYLFSS